MWAAAIAVCAVDNQDKCNTEKSGQDNQRDSVKSVTCSPCDSPVCCSGSNTAERNTVSCVNTGLHSHQVSTLMVPAWPLIHHCYSWSCFCMRLSLCSLLAWHADSPACSGHLLRTGHQYWHSHQILVPLHPGSLCLARRGASNSMYVLHQQK